MLINDELKFQASLPPRADSAAEARQLVSRALSDWGLSGAEDTAQTLVTELVSNGVRHAHTPLDLLVSFDGSRLHLEVGDGASTIPTLAAPSLRSHRGWGLQLIGTLSSDWGTTINATGKVVWCEIDLDHVSATTGGGPSTVR